ncbi:hypothetical protein DICVIV_11092 [Dictyocaulus viviparus]|uniref:Uncharacterized protein n=1 Tax=Dictyocaulus viviparus TaxID=29172 RepID=A0A0D8XKP5_DICVI|nr:hypothetical protein DICVIV_11092 [Dictyocaulus viviparus]
MLHSLCRCEMNKVDDKNDIVIRDYRNTVFIYTSCNVLRRSLLGALFTAFENANLKAVEIIMMRPSHDVIKKSMIWKKNGRLPNDANETCVISLWRGDDVFKHTLNIIVQFCNTYAFHRGVDIIMTDSTKTTRREGQLWIDPLTSSLLPSIPITDDVDTTNAHASGNLNDMMTQTADFDDVPPIHNGQNSSMVPMQESSTADTIPLVHRRDSLQKSHTHPLP